VGMNDGMLNKKLSMENPKQQARGWGIIFLFLTGLLFFIYVLGPFMLQSPMIKPIAIFIEENEINANGYYYTDVAEFSDAEMHMRNTFDYAPQTIQ